MLNDYSSKKMYGNGYYLILALDKKSRNRVKERLLDNNKFNRFQVLLDN